MGTIGRIKANTSQLTDAGVKLCGFSDELNNIITDSKRIVTDLSGSMEGTIAQKSEDVFNELYRELLKYVEEIAACGEAVKASSAGMEKIDASSAGSLNIVS